MEKRLYLFKDGFLEVVQSQRGMQHLQCQEGSELCALFIKCVCARVWNGHILEGKR